MSNQIKSFETQLEAIGCDIHSPAWPDKFANFLQEFCSKADYQKKPIRVLSLFSGAGGLDIGFKNAGFEIVESVELEDKFCETLEANSKFGGYFPESKVNCIDIREYTPDCNEIDFVIGGPPCQTFSAAGRRANGVLGTSDARGVLFKEYVRILNQLNPKGFLFENVYGIIGAQGGGPWKLIRQSFEEIGYTLSFRVLDAADYGTPQHRERLIIVGLKNGTYRFPRPLFGVDSLDKTTFYDAKTAIANANRRSDEIPTHIKGRFGYLIDEIPPGLNYSYYTEKMGHPKPVFAWRSKFSDFMYKADPEQPVRTIKAQGGQYTGPYHWEGRHFSLPEYKRLQTFPDEYIICGGRGTVIHQLGNSVPPQLSRILALTIREQVFGKKSPVQFEYLNEDDVLSFRKEKTKRTKIYREKAAAAIAVLKKVQGAKLATKSYTADLDDNFAFKKNEQGWNGQYIVEVKVDDDDVLFLLNETVQKKGMESGSYSLEINPVKKWDLPYKCIKGEARGNSRLILTVLWKTIENAIADAGSVADLVQLNGYYQYSPNLEIRLETEMDSSIDRILVAISNGSCTRRLMGTAELANLWGVHDEDVRDCAKEIRLLGFEVRNNNTNPQIPTGEWLIPYEFPTLNPMSIQLRKQV